MKRSSFRSLVAIAGVVSMLHPGAAILRAADEAATGGTLSDQEKEQFLRKAKVVKSREISTGITGSTRLTLRNGELTHDAHLQTIDVYKPIMQLSTGTEINFRDSYKFNIAGYKLDRLLNLGMVPVSVERSVHGHTGSVTWWVDDVLMMEKERYLKKIEVPDQDAWNDQIYQARVFNELIYNTDPNLGNLLITKDWKLRLIDFTRGFRISKELKNPKNLNRIDRRVYEGLRGLNEEMLKRELRSLLDNIQIKGILARRDRILRYFDEQIAERGEAALICDLPGH